jgi:hypothetical protein
MSFQIRFLAAQRIVRVSYLGRTGLAARIAASKLVVEKYRHLQPLRLLVDVRFSKTLMTALEQRQFGRYLAEHPVLGRARIAVLHRADFYPTAVIVQEATSHGALFRQFLVEAEAEAWLRL